MATVSTKTFNPWKTIDYLFVRDTSCQRSVTTMHDGKTPKDGQRTKNRIKSLFDVELGFQGVIVGYPGLLAVPGSQDCLVKSRLQLKKIMVINSV